MSYPPQPPDPYGEQGGYGQYPQYGQDPQYGWSPYGYYPQPGQHAQPGSFGGPPPPPKKRRTGLLASLSAGALLLLAFLLTAFVAPGFLVGGDNGPRKVAQATASALDAHDRTALRRLTCSGATVTVRAAIDAVGDVRSARLESVRRPAPDRAVAEIAVRAGGTRATVDATFTRENGKWCWQDVSLTRGIASAPQGGVPPVPSERPTGPPPGAPPVPSLPGNSGELVDARKAIEEFVTAVNDGDRAAATKLACDAQRGSIEREVDAASSDGARLQLRPNSLVGAEGFVNATLYRGAERSASVTVERDTPNETYCVSFFVYF